MPTVSGDTFALPPSCSCHAVVRLGGPTSCGASSPYAGANKAPLAVAYFLRVSDFMMTSFQTMSRVCRTGAGQVFGTKMPKYLASGLKPATAVVMGGIVP